MLILHTLICLVAVSALSICVKIGNQIVPRGKLVNGEAWTFVPATSSPLPSSGQACAGIQDDSGNFECQHLFTLQEEPRDAFKVLVDQSGRVRVSATPGPLSAEFSYPVSVNRPTPRKPATILTGENSEVLPEPEKSFLAKYWYFFIPVGIILATGGGGRS